MKYTIGVDFGTQSGRSILVEVETGNIVAQAVKTYPHGVMDETIPCGKRLPPDWALQHPQDYLDVFYETIPAVLAQSGVNAADVIGMSVDFTACTILPTKADGTPLCFLDEWKNEPHSYVKLWKHHAAQADANKLNETAEKLGEGFLPKYGGKISSEWLVPKVMQIAREAPEVYDAAERILEAADWVTWQLTGVETRNSCTAGYKAIWSKREGYPGKAFYKALDPKMENIVEEKLSTDIRPQGGKAGELTREMAQKLGLLPGTAVGIANVDAHVAVPAVGITKEGQLLMIMGTSTCHILLGARERMVPGICGYVEDGVLPGYFGFEAGQSCVGDHFEWFVENCVPGDYKEEAIKRGMNIHELLVEKAEKLKVGESGLLALDWWNGNRSVLVDVDLTGLLLGATLLTKPEEIYRALIEATAFGTNMIIENFEKHGVPVNQLFACGGISEKNAFMMQIYADVTGREIFVSDTTQTVALGSAMFGAVAAGKAKGGYDTIFEAAKVMPRVREKPFRPIPANREAYKKLYAEYERLHDYFGRGGNDVMKNLKAIKAEVIG